MMRNLKANMPFEPNISELPKIEGNVHLVGSGPSLDDALDYLTTVDEPMIVCDGSIWAAKKHNLRPLYVMTCELDCQDDRPGKPSTELLLEYGNLSYYAHTPLLCPTWTNRYFIKKWPGPVYYYVPKTRRYERQPEHIPKIAPTMEMVGMHAIAMADYLEANTVYLYGYDCKATNDRHHCESFPLDEWEVDLEHHFSGHRERSLEAHKGYLGHINVINRSPGSALTPPDFLCVNAPVPIV